MLNTSTKLVVLISLAASTLLAVGITAYAPAYVPGTPLENGLIVRVQYDKPIYYTFETVKATYYFYNPQNYPITFRPPSIQSVESGYVGGLLDKQIHGGFTDESVTLAPKESYSIEVYSAPALSMGVFSVDVNGTSSTVEIQQGSLSIRVSTDRDVYVVGQGSGTASLEIVNSGSTPMRYENFSPLELRYWYSGEALGDIRKVTFVSWMDRYTTVQPGETHVVWEESFPIGHAGVLMLDFNGVRRSVTILPG